MYRIYSFGDTEGDRQTKGCFELCVYVYIACV